MRVFNRKAWLSTFMQLFLINNKPVEIVNGANDIGGNTDMGRYRSVSPLVMSLQFFLSVCVLTTKSSVAMVTLD